MSASRASRPTSSSTSTAPPGWHGPRLSYGEGITYWPLVEILIELGIDPDEAIMSSPADTQLVTRARLERAAEEQPLVVVLDDLQWAEAPVLDLIEHVADWSREAPIFLLCVARPSCSISGQDGAAGS